MTNRIFRYEVPVDGQWHALLGHANPLHVACRNNGIVEFWAWERSLDRYPIEYRVYGTGESVDDLCDYLGTALSPNGQLVWHLMRRS